ncbi:MAG: electron transport complex subunit RsxE [Firmicutes bacterium]|nr:electron transport complex subunit RsxE [Bacillota bacterium]
METGKGREILLNGFIYENPLLITALGICPALAVTTQARTGLAMGLSVLFVSVCSNLMISALKRVIPKSVRIPCYMVIIASFVTIARTMITAYVPALENSLGIYLPLMVVNCAIFGRAESFASKNSMIRSVLDGIGTGLGYTLALTLMGVVREAFGSGSVFGIPLGILGAVPVTLFLFAPGGLFTLGCLMAAARKVIKTGSETSNRKKCAGCPASGACPMSGKGGCER